ncbi:MAG TPA: HNH endonuclease [Terriglobia bacterium]
MLGARTRAQVRERAQNTCEYCHLHQDDSPLAPLHIEHIVPKSHGGSDDLDNLALACIDCNLHTYRRSIVQALTATSPSLRSLWRNA